MKLAGADAEDVDAYDLDAPSPHPVHGTSTISFRLRNQSHVTLALYDLLGRRVGTLVNDRRGKGPYTVRVSPRALGLTSGVYFYRLTVQDGFDHTRFRKTRKMVIVR